MNIVSYELWEKHPNLIIMLPAKMFYSPEISNSLVTDLFIKEFEDANSGVAEPVNYAIRVWLTSSFWHYSFHSIEDVEDVFVRFTRFHSIIRQFLHSLRCVPVSWYWERTCIIKPESKLLISSKPSDSVIPRLIHSSWKYKVPENEGLFYSVISWKVRNPDYELKIWVDDEMDRFVKRHFPAYYQIYSKLPHVIYKADFFRYLVVYVYGGFYSDIDTESIQPLDELIPNWRNEGISAFIAVEEDNTFGYKGNRHPGTARVVQLCQWTFAFSPKHPLLLYIIERVYSQLEVISKYNLFEIGVLELTGPGIWTDVIFEYLRANYPSDFPKIEQTRNPIKFGTDFVILPVVYFSTIGHGVHHFHDRDERNFVRHGFQGSWRYDNFMIPMGDQTKEFVRRQYIDIKANWFL